VYRQLEAVHAQLIQIAGASHDVQEDQPRVLADALTGFLKKNRLLANLAPVGLMSEGTMKHQSFLTALGLALLSLAIGHSSFVQAQAWPTKPVKFILPYPAGGSTDSLLRILSDKLNLRLQQPFIVENKPGGLTLIGSMEVARAAPDGYTLLLNANGITMFQLSPKSVFDVRRDLQPITILRGGMMGAWISPTLPVNNLKEFIAYAKANPGKLNYASNGSGSDTNIQFELFKQQAGGLDIVQIPYKGEAPSIQALMAGEVQIYLGSFLLLAQHRAAGRVKLIAVGGSKRAPAAPDVPTYREQGVLFTHTYWSGFFGPAKLPLEIARKLQTELKAIYQLPDVYPILTRNGEDLGGQAPEEFARQIAEEATTWEGVVKRAGIVLE
jgi:tripartite-type tricarboxylate transporter receptor subunit TctC